MSRISHLDFVHKIDVIFFCEGRLAGLICIHSRFMGKNNTQQHQANGATVVITGNVSSSEQTIVERIGAQNGQHVHFRKEVRLFAQS